MGVPQYTTPVFTLTFADIAFDLREMAGVYVTFAASGYLLTKSCDDLDVGENSIAVRLAQDETARLRGDVSVQANWIDWEGNRGASEIAKVAITENLLKRVIS